MRRIVDLAEEMLELLMAVGQVFLVEDCVEPLTLYNTALKTELSELLQSLDATRYATGVGPPRAARFFEKFTRHLFWNPWSMYERP